MVSQVNPINKSSDQFLLASYEGSGGFKTGDYLVRHVREQDDEFLRRKQLAIYPNYCRKIVDVYGGYLWKVPPNRTGLNDVYSAFLKNADGIGTDLDNVLANYQRLANILGTVYIIVDKSPTKATSKADETLPYLTVRFHTQLTNETKDSFGQWKSVTFSETINNETRYRTFTETSWSLSAGEDLVGVASGEHGLGRVPIIQLHAMPKLRLMDSKSTSFFSDLSALNWSLFNLHSELRALLRDQTFAILTLPASSKEDRAALSNLTIGTQNGLVYNPANSGVPAFIAPPPDSIESYRKYIADTVGDIYRSANLEFVGGVQASGVALAFHFEEANAAMTTINNETRRAEMEIKDLVARYQKTADEGSVIYNKNFNLIDLAKTLDVAMTAVNMQLGGEFDREIKKRVARNILGNDTNSETMAKIEEEIDADGDVYGNRVAQQVNG
jgi:hypothetical protein